MKPLSRIVLTAAVFVGIATFAAAATPSDVLNKLEVQKLVGLETTVANLRLALHFNALADQFFVDADRHRALASVFRANANRSATTTAGDQCDRLAARAEQWGGAAVELAVYYGDLASGIDSVLPARAIALQGGYGAPEPTAEQLHKLALTARTRLDHLELREYYATLAKKRAAEADDYAVMVTAYRVSVRNGAYDPGVAYERLARIARKAAKEATEAANRHQVFANIG
jgi:hypothetical protein